MNHSVCSADYSASSDNVSVRFLCLIFMTNFSDFTLIPLRQVCLSRCISNTILSKFEPCSLSSFTSESISMFWRRINLEVYKTKLVICEERFFPWASDAHECLPPMAIHISALGVGCYIGFLLCHSLFYRLSRVQGFLALLIFII